MRLSKSPSDKVIHEDVGYNPNGVICTLCFLEEEVELASCSGFKSRFTDLVVRDLSAEQHAAVVE